MIHPNIQTFPSTAELATAFANWLVEITAGKDSFSIALSGGRTPIYLFDQLVARYSDKIDWQKIKFYWGDERCVPPQHEESNYRSASEHLLAPLNIPAENVFRMHKTDPRSPCPVAAQLGQVLSAPLKAAECALHSSLAQTSIRDVATAIV
jgi:6-phosphogluconolactonase